jgi:hypothetical protein
VAEASVAEVASEEAAASVGAASEEAEDSDNHFFISFDSRKGLGDALPSPFHIFLLYLHTSAHPITIVFVCVTAKKFERSILMQHADGRMPNTVEHRCLHGGIVYHIFENQGFPNLQFMVKTPITHKVTRKTRVATDSVDS